MVRERVDRTTQLVNFIHINKNGGTSIRYLLAKNYRRGQYFDAMIQGRRGADGYPKTAHGLDMDVHEVICEIQNLQNALECVATNLPFGLHQYLDRPVSYFSFLREPVSRCLSYWYFAYRNRSIGGLWPTIERYDRDVIRVVQSGFAYQFSNDQVRMISGSANPEPGRSEFQQACERIKTDYQFVGALEHFGPCIAFLARQYGWSDASLMRCNEGLKDEKSILPTNAEKHFREANEWDIRLYEWLVTHYLPSKFAGRLLSSGIGLAAGRVRSPPTLLSSRPPR